MKILARFSRRGITMMRTQQVLLVGKGGVGKTTLATALGRTLWLQGMRVLLVDADPDGTLAFMLDAPETQTVADLKEQLKEAREQVVPDLRPYIARVKQGALDVLRVGRGEGPGCYCRPNNLLRQGLQPLLAAYDWVIVDSVAGTEFMSRSVVQPTAVLVVQRSSQLDPLGVTARVAATVHQTLDGLPTMAQCPRFDVVIGGSSLDDVSHYIAVPSLPIANRLTDDTCAMLVEPVLTALTLHVV
jgi:CO dehydrogenase maturation factor